MIERGKNAVCFRHKAGAHTEAAKSMNTTEDLIAALEDALALLKEGHRKAQADASLEIAAVVRKGETAIRQARQAERENAVMIKPQPAGVKIDGWDV